MLSYIHECLRCAELVDVGKMSPKIAITSLIMLFVVIVAGGNYYYRVYLKPEAPVYKSLCARQIAELDAAIASQYGKGALRVLNLQPDARVTEKEINQARSIRGVGVQLLKDNQERLCLEALLRAKAVMKM